MNALTIREWGKAQNREVDFIGWKDRERRAFFIRDAGTRREIKLVLPELDGLDFRENPIPDLPVVKIIKTALHLPASFASKAECEGFAGNLWSAEARRLLLAGETWKRASRQRIKLGSQDAACFAHRCERAEASASRDRR